MSMGVQMSVCAPALFSENVLWNGIAGPNSNYIFNSLKNPHSILGLFFKFVMYIISCIPSIVYVYLGDNSKMRMNACIPIGLIKKKKTRVCVRERVQVC